jgi:hypothetical protein
MHPERDECLCLTSLCSYLDGTNSKKILFTMCYVSYYIYTQIYILIIYQNLKISSLLLKLNLSTN